MGSERSLTGQQPSSGRMGTLDGLFDKLGQLRKESRKGAMLLLARASDCVSNDAQAKTLSENFKLVFEKMTKAADGQCFQLHGLDYAFLLNNKNEAAREFLPNLRIALFKVLSRSGAGQSSSTGGDGLTFEHFDLEADFNAAAKFVVSYIKMAQKAKSNPASADGVRLLTEDDLKAVIAAYREIGAQKFLKNYARGQQICVSTEKGYLKPKMTEFYISLDHLKKPFFEGIDLHANSDRFNELTKILDSIMLNAFPTLSKMAPGKQISLNLNVQSVFSKAFDTFIAQTPKEVMRNVVIEFTQEDAVLNYDGYAIAREHLRNKGALVAIDQIAPSAIGLINIGFLDAQIAKLHWQSNCEKDLFDRREVVDSFRRNNIRPVLSRVDQARAHDVGMEIGIEMYQGFLIDDRLRAEHNRSAASVV
jgi:EAL domain-containing protein (putative c-di-GMP-specific phosphodiesterase class I)